MSDRTKTLILLGAGASVDAGLQTTVRLTHDVVSSCIAARRADKESAAAAKEQERLALLLTVEDHVNSLIAQELLRANRTERFPTVDVVDPGHPPFTGPLGSTWARALLGNFDLDRVEQVSHLHLHQARAAEYLAAGLAKVSHD